MDRLAEWAASLWGLVRSDQALSPPQTTTTTTTTAVVAATTGRSTLLDELVQLDQPVMVCSPQAYTVEYWFDLNDRMFATKDLSTVSRTFDPVVTDDDDGGLVVFAGLTRERRRWRIEIRRMDDPCFRKKYLADVHMEQVR